MDVLKTVKNHYQKPFRVEIYSPLLLALHRLTTVALALAYRLIHYKKLKRSAAALLGIRAEVSVAEKSVFVFANGPSLSDIDLGKIKVLLASGDYDLIAINSFLSTSAREVMPTYAVFADNVHFRPGDSDSQYSRDIEVCRENSVKYFVPFQHFDEKDDLQIGYNAFCNVFSNNTSHPLRSPGYYGVTAFHALRLAKYLGYKNIYICGFDNSYFKDFALNEAGRLVIRHRHFYDDVGRNIEVPSIYSATSEFFFDTYRHFYYLEKILSGSKNCINIAKTTYLSCVRKCNMLDVYKRS